MDPGVASQVTQIVHEQIDKSQNAILDKLEHLMSVKLDSFQHQINETQRVLSDAEVSKIEQMNSEAYKFNKRGNEEQYKVNAKVCQKLREADAILKENHEMTTDAQEKIAEGIDILQHRQKLIKLADSSEMGWQTVN